MKIIFMGTPDFAVGTLQALAEAGHEMQLVVSQPDKPRGRGKEMQPTPVKAEALKLGIPVETPAKVRDEAFLEKLEALAPDAIVVAAFGQIIPQRLLDIPKYGCFNVHASLLPAYRGAAPIQRAVMDGQKESGVTIMRMDAGLDTGDMVSRVVLPLAEDETGGSLFDKLSAAGAKLLVDTLPAIQEGRAVFEKQPEESTTDYAAMIRKQDGKIDWSQPAVKIERLVRAMNPWPSAYTGLNGKMLKIWKAEVVEEMGAKEPGQILALENDGILVQTGAQSLRIKELQIEGKKRMSADAFLRGSRITENSILEI